MLGVTAALVGHEIRADIERELRGVGGAAGEHSIYIHLIALAGSLDRTLTVGIIPIVGHEAVVVHREQTVLLVPDELALSCADFIMSIVHHTSGIHIYKVSVLVIQIYVIVLDFIVSRSLFRAIIHVFNTCKLELLPVFSAVGVGEVIAYIERTVELHVVLGQMLALGCDAVHIVVAHGKGIRCRLIVGTCIRSRRTCQTVQSVVGIGVRHLAAGIAALGKRGVVSHRKDIADRITPFDRVKEDLENNYYLPNAAQAVFNIIIQTQKHYTGFGDILKTAMNSESNFITELTRHNDFEQLCYKKILSQSIGDLFVKSLQF